MYGTMRWWLDRGVDGFRLDVVNWFVKDAEFRSNPPSLVPVPDIFQRHVYDRNRPETHGICREMRALVDSYGGDRVLVGEIFCRDPAEAASYHGERNDELHMAFNFDLLYQPWSARKIHASVRRWYAALPEGAWPNLTLSNHDQRRHATRFAGTDAAETDARLRVAAALLLTLRGTPFLYYGEELGMRQGRIRRQDLRDPLGVRTWPLGFLGRDGCRTPMQWSAEPNAGFTSGTPWLPLNSDFRSRNAEIQASDPDSLLSFYRRLIALRSSSPALAEGDIRFLEEDHPDAIVFERRCGDAVAFVALNFSPRLVSVRRGGSAARLEPYGVLIDVG